MQSPASFVTSMGFTHFAGVDHDAEFYEGGVDRAGTLVDKDNQLKQPRECSPKHTVLRM